MKSRVVILASVLATICLLLFALTAPRPMISLTLLEYKRWPHGAMLLLSNATPTTIRYLSQPGDTPAGKLFLCLQKTPDGWTNASPTVRSGTGNDPRTRKTVEFFYVANPAALPKPGDRIDVLQSRELGPGQSAEFFVRLEPGEMPRKLGTVCYLPQNGLQKKLRPWLERL